MRAPVVSFFLPCERGLNSHTDVITRPHLSLAFWLQAQSGLFFYGERWMSTFGNYLVEKRGSDLVSVVHVGVGRMQSI